MLFESQQDQQNEQAVASRFVEWLKAKKNLHRSFNKLEGLSPIDYAICSGRTVTSWLECKVRKFDSQQYHSVIIDQRKFVELLEFASWTICPVYLATLYSDGNLFLYRVGPDWRKDILEVRWLKRTNPRWSLDNKPVVLLNKDAFIPIR